MGMPKATSIDLFIFVWGVSVVIYGRIKLGSLGAFPISFTGWSWFLLASRAGLELMAWVAFTNDHMRLASTFATTGSSIRFVTITNACVVCTIWNFILFPIIYFKSIPAGEKRQNFLRFNFSWFMTNIHILNFPLSCFNIIYGEKSRVRLFTDSGKSVRTFSLISPTRSTLILFLPSVTRFVGSICSSASLLRSLLFLHGSPWFALLPDIQSTDCVFLGFYSGCSWSLLLPLLEME